MDVEAEVVVASQGAAPGVEAHAHPHLPVDRPGVALEPALGVDRRPDGVDGGAEHDAC